MGVVDRYRCRRKKRLDEKEVDWITTKNGIHVPIGDNGNVVGGPLKGKNFSEATSNGQETKGQNTKKRKQVDISWVKNGRFPDASEVAEWNKRATESIMKETGMDREEAEELRQTMIDYFGGDYAAYAKGYKSEKVKKIDDGLSRMEKFDGEMFRGMVFRDKDASLFKKFEDISVGDELGMRSISSWSSDENIADTYSLSGGYGLNSVLIRCKKNKSSVGVQHISKYGVGESEVLAPSSAKWKVVGKSVKTQKEVADKRGEIDSYIYKTHPEKYDNYKVIVIEVEEI